MFHKNSSVSQMVKFGINLSGYLFYTDKYSVIPTLIPYTQCIHVRCIVTLGVEKWSSGGDL